MKKDYIRIFAASAVLLVLYILVAFLIPFVHTAVFWVSFVFTLVAFAVVTATLCIALVNKPDVKSKFYGFPIARIGVIYGVVQLVAGLMFMTIGKWAPVWAAVLVYAIMLGVTVVGLIGADTVAENVRAQDVKLKKDVSLMRDLQSRLNQMVSRCDNPDIAAAVKRFADELRYSDPVSSESLTEVEQDLSTVIDELQTAVVNGDSIAAKKLCGKASDLLAERNRLCKLNKG